jgi:hypothetical protein
MDRSLGSPTAGIELRATERGLPIALKLEQRALSRPPTQLAHDILTLCQLSALRAQVARRRDLVAGGFSPSVIRSLNLGTEEELARAEAQLAGDDEDGHPETWLERV